MENDSHPPVRRPLSAPPIRVARRTYLDTGDRYGPAYGSPTGTSRIGVFFRRRRWTILIGFVSVMAAVTALTFLLPKKYQSTASFLVEQRRATTSNAPALAVLERLGDVASRQTEVELIRSRRVVEPVVESGNLHVTLEGPDGEVRPEAVFGWFHAGVEAQPGEYQLTATADLQFAVRDAKTGATLATAGPDEPIAFANISAVTPVEGLGGASYTLTVSHFAEAVQQTVKLLEVTTLHREADLIELTCTNRTPEEAQGLCEAISQSYLSLRAELQQAEATAAAEFLADQTELVRRRLVEAEDSLRAYTEREHAVALDTRAAEEVKQGVALWAEREQLRAERASLASLIQQIENDSTRGTRKYRDLAAFPTFLKNQNQIVTELVANLIELENRRNDLAIRRSDKDVELAALDHRIADLEHQMRAIATGYERALSAQITSLDDGLRNSDSLLATIPVQQIETARRERQVSLFEDLFGFLQTRLQEAEIAQAVELPSVRVVDHPALPFEPSAPNVPLNLSLGLLLATSFGVMLGLWQDNTDTRMRTHDQVAEYTGLPVLSLLPKLKGAGPVISVTLPAVGEQKSVALTPAWTSQRELALEAFRTLSADLNFVGQGIHNGDLGAVAVTSAGRDEGKTFTACNLAIVRASHGTRTLLIDADLRGRGASRFFKLPSAAGLTELLTAGGELREVVQSIQVGAGNTMYLLPAGAGTSHSAELLESDRFRDLLEHMTSRFDLVVVDTPPLNVVTDAAAVAARVDGVLLVVRGGHTDRAALQLTLARLERAGANVVGMVLNDVDLPSYYRTYDHEA